MNSTKTLIKGDCLIEMMKLDKGSVDLVLCDPPYGFFKKTTGWDNALPFDKMWECLDHVCKKDAMVILFGAEPFSSYLRMSALEGETPFKYKYDIYWNKLNGGNFANVKYRPWNIIENMMLFTRGKPTYNPQMIKRSAGSIDRYPVTDQAIPGTAREEDRFSVHGIKTIGGGLLANGDKNPTNVLEVCLAGPSNESGKHPTQKPVKLLMNMVLQYSEEGDTVLDMCAGSGSTGVACIKTQRSFIGIELDEKFFSVMDDRLSQPINVRMI